MIYVLSGGLYDIYHGAIFAHEHIFVLMPYTQNLLKCVWWLLIFTNVI